MRIRTLIKKLAEETSGDEISIKEINEVAGYQGFGPLLLVPALITALPTGAIPLVPDMCGLFICLVSGQIIMGRKKTWLPAKLANFSIKKQKFNESIEKADPFIGFLDSLFKPRFALLADNVIARYLIALMSVILGLAMFPLGFIPFAVFPAALILLFFSIGLTTKDGLMVALGLIGLCAGAAYLYYTLFF
ncbi:MAG: exopolysaccharide biosynthesis protein exod [Micavibrio sp.]|nr:exopolysaccharide biosynthesis protein exod [Micavibrio sp.]|tara:strand:- start:1224 stop:1796 length:573 start_codon:yes stop_codon:yes gene_type:complete